MTEGAPVEVGPVPDPRESEPRPNNKPLLEYPREQVCLAAIDGESMYDSIDGRVISAMKAALNGEVDDPESYLRNNGDLRIATYDLLDLTHAIRGDNKVHSVGDFIATTDGRLPRVSLSKKHYERARRILAAHSGPNDLLTLLDLIFIMPDNVYSFDEIRRVYETPNNPTQRELADRVVSTMVEIRAEEQKEGLKRKPKGLTLDKKDTPPSKYNKYRQIINDFLLRGGSAQLLRSEMLKAEESLLEVLEGKKTDGGHQSASEGDVRSELNGSVESLVDFDRELVRAELDRAFQDGSLMEFEHAMPSALKEYFGSIYTAIEGSPPPYMFEDGDNQNFRERFERYGLPGVIYSAVKYANSTGNKEKSVNEIFTWYDNEKQETNAKRHEEHAQLSGHSLTDGAYSQPLLYAITLPDQGYKGGHVPKIPDEPSAHRSFRRRIGELNQKANFRLSHDRNEIIAQMLRGTPHTKLTQPDLKMKRQLADAEECKSIRDALIIYSTLPEGPLTRVMAREWALKSEAWLLKRLQKSTQDEILPPSDLEPVKREVVRHPEDVLVTREETVPRQFTPEMPAGMKRYGKIVDHFGGKGYKIAFSQGTVKPGEEHGIRVGDRPANHARIEPKDNESAPVDTRRLDIAGFTPSDTAEQPFELEDFADGSCYVEHPGVVRFWRNVFGDQYRSFNEMLDKYSRRHMRLLGSFPFDHVTIQGVAWDDRVINYIEEKEDFDVIDMMLTDLFDEYDKPPYLFFDESGKLGSHTIHDRSRTGNKEWDLRVPDHVLSALSEWLDKPENEPIRTALQQKKTMDVAKMIAPPEDKAVS